MVAFNANKFVCAAMPEIMVATVPIRDTRSVSAAIACCAASPVWTARPTISVERPT